MILVPRSELVVGENRQRRVFDEAALGELRESIDSTGLMHPLVVRENGGTMHLVAGERRLRAIEALWMTGGTLRCGGQNIAEGWLPVVTMGELEPLAAQEAELEENIRRLDLSWQDRAAAIKGLHELRKAQNNSHRVQDTAKEIYDRDDGGYSATTREMLALADHLDDPDVAKAKSAAEGYRILARKEELAETTKRAAIIGQTFGAHSHRLLLGDCREWLAQLEPGQFDCVVTDPPYGMGADQFGDSGGRFVGPQHEYRDEHEPVMRMMEQVAPLLTKVAKTEAHLYVCCDVDQFVMLKWLFQGQGWNVFRTPLVNYKQGTGGRVPLPEHGPRRCYELILYAYRGGKRVTGIYPDVIESRFDAADGDTAHGAQKPISLYAELLRRSCKPGDSILDPFAGSGTVFPAAHGLLLRATGIELAPAYYGIAAKRIEELK